MKRTIAIALLAGLVLPVAVRARAQGGSLTLPPYKRVKLSNGMTLLLSEQHEVPIISFSFIVRAGSIDDPAGKEGVASLTAALLRKGTASRVADQISSELDFIGGDLDAGVQYDYSFGSAEFVKKDLDKGLDLLSDVLEHASFPDQEVTKMLKQRADEIKSAKDRAPAVIGAYFASYLYGAHPYARPVGGDERSIAGITRSDAVSFYQARYKPDQVILAAVGDFNSAEMEKALTQKFGGWQGRGAAQTKVSTPAPFTGKKLLLVDKPDATQTYFQIGNV